MPRQKNKRKKSLIIFTYAGSNQMLNKSVMKTGKRLFTDFKLSKRKLLAIKKTMRTLRKLEKLLT